MPISVRLSPEDEARLDALAQRTGRTKTFYLREALHEHLDELEERFWAEDAARRWEASDRSSRPAHQLWDELDL
ncbi:MULTISPECIES: type II toxin-antitoxin system RelB family antitoxin [Brevibacterium]|jgi:RHH-type rel operon transcriptional repressor/antitoxin RelB|uniref:Relaxosome protein TraY n=1 Tax=Brevibacterium salitolerans TaxID=1403566 RepID=A0ABN2WS24_9MICO|nr:TraY domain-containing protein [Brevibacterium sp.]